jgi:hypothetical protein
MALPTASPTGSRSSSPVSRLSSSGLELDSPGSSPETRRKAAAAATDTFSSPLMVVAGATASLHDKVPAKAPVKAAPVKKPEKKPAPAKGPEKKPEPAKALVEAAPAKGPEKKPEPAAPAKAPVEAEPAKEPKAKEVSKAPVNTDAGKKLPTSTQQKAGCCRKFILPLAATAVAFSAGFLAGRVNPFDQ